MDEPPLAIEPLGAHHGLRTFSCGEPALGNYLRRQASRDARRRVARIFVAVGDTPGRVAGYYTLSAASFEKEDLPADLARRLPHYPVPAAVLGRLATDSTYQGRGLGELLLLDAVCRVVRASATIAVYAIVVDAKNECAQTFCKRYGFKAFVSVPRRLYLPLDTFRKLGL